MDSILIKVIKGDNVTENDIEDSLYEICDKCHSSCSSRCLVYRVNNNSVPKDEDDCCMCFKNGHAMLDFIKNGISKGKTI